MAISTLVKGRAPYRNVLVNDLILDKDGVKMSKSKGNAVDPFEQFDKFGADATRWYLLHTSPAWSPTRYDEEGVKEIAGKFFGTLRNTYYFFALYANQDGVDPRAYDSDYAGRPELDRWILSRFSRLIMDVIADMDAYDHMKAVRRIQDFVIEDLSNWYIRRARRRFWATELDDDKKAVYATAYEVLKGVAQLAAPMAPFITDEIYTKLTGEESVHLSLYPEADESLIDAALEEKMGLVRDIVGLGRGIRENERIKVRQPLPSVLLDGRYEELLRGMEDLIKEELNIKAVRYESDLGAYMDYSVKPDFKVAGPKLGARMKDFAASVARADAAELLGAFEGGGPVLWSIPEARVVRHADADAADAGAAGPAGAAADAEAAADVDASASPSADEVLIERDFVIAHISAKEGFAVATEGGVFTILDRTLTPELISEGLMREFVSKVQQLRKQAGLEMMDNIEISYDADDEVAAAIDAYRPYIMKETLALSLTKRADSYPAEYDLNGRKAGIDIARL
jgi:isoleucyl-tRNA synthetase